MEMISDILVHRTKHSKIREVDFDRLEFGKYVSDHMLVSDYANGEWRRPEILPYGNIPLAPSALCLHYGQTVFEGMKAFRLADGRINIFRLEKHYDRFVRSLERMCMAILPKEIFAEGLIRLVELDREWVPFRKGDALYIRPFVFATEAKFGVKVSDEYRFVIFTGPVPDMYVKPIKVKVETEFIRAAKGGTGYAKCGGNYGAAFLPTQMARRQGYDQVLWTNAAENKYIEESGTMNVMFVIDGTIVTPPVSDSIIEGITRDSLLKVARELGYATEERPISFHELEMYFRAHKITEAFGTGTAAVVAPISLINIDGIDFKLPEYSHDSILYRLKNRLELIRTGRVEDKFDWNTVIGTRNKE